MATTYLSSYQLKFPRLVFDYGLPMAEVAFDAADGMKRFGPYDKRQPRKTAIRCAVAYPKSAGRQAQRLIIAFRDGMFHFRGFPHFSHGIEIQEFCEYPLDVTVGASPAKQAAEFYQSYMNYEAALRDMDLAFVVLPSAIQHSMDTPYAVSKTFFSKIGVPTQMVSADKIGNDSDFKWSLANIATACYAKLGNIPWVIQESGTSNDLIIGFGKREFREDRLGQIRRCFGFTTAYRNNGAFVTFQGLAPTRSEENLGKQLEAAIVSALRQYAAQQRKLGYAALVPDRVIVHSFKKVGPSEIAAVENATRYVSDRTSASIQYLLVHLEEQSSLYMFDTADRTWLPEAGRVVKLSRRQAMLVTEGRERFNKRKMGFPHPFRVTLDDRSQVDVADYDDVLRDLLAQILALSKINWRGLNAAAIPVTLNYSRLLAEVAGFCRTDEDWKTIVEQKSLQDKAWFL